jgi:hypothetical protein
VCLRDTPSLFILIRELWVRLGGTPRLFIVIGALSVCLGDTPSLFVIVALSVRIEVAPSLLAKKRRVFSLGYSIHSQTPSDENG